MAFYRSQLQLVPTATRILFRRLVRRLAHHRQQKIKRIQCRPTGKSLQRGLSDISSWLLKGCYRWPIFSITANAKRMSTLPITYCWQWEAILPIRTPTCGLKTWINSSSKWIHHLCEYKDLNLEKFEILRYANERQINGSRFNLLYSTPSCYVKALNDLKKSWPVKTDDFFPYGSDAHSYWTGYFTSRPAFKYMVRQASNLLQVYILTREDESFVCAGLKFQFQKGCKQMESVLSRSRASNEGDLDVMKRAMGIVQHHDAVSGTEKGHVAADYARLLHEGVVECQKTQASYYQWDQRTLSA